MKNLNSQLTLFINLAKAHAIANRRFSNSLSQWGLGLNEFIILLHLSQAPDEKMRRIDLAEAIGLTASGVTRMLAPMEKIGLIKREANAHDARVSLVVLAPSGKRILSESLETAEWIADEWVAPHSAKKIKDASDILKTIASHQP